MRTLRIVPFLACLFAVTPIFSQQSSTQPPAPRPMTSADISRFRDVSDAQISPDAQWVAYTVTNKSLKDDKVESRIYMVPAAGGDPIALTAEGNSSSSPRWSPDGKSLAFLSARNEGKSQVYLLNLHGGEAQRLTDTIQDVDSFAWAPDSHRLVLVLRDPSPEELEAAASKGKDADDDKPAAKKSKTQRPWVIDRLQFKEDTVGYLDRRRDHLYVFDIPTKSLTQVTSGDFDDSAPAWSPDGKFLAFQSNRSQPDPDATYDINIWTVAADNKDKGAHLTQITKNPGEDVEPTWSPDGRSIAYVTRTNPKLFEYATRHVAIAPASGSGEEKLLTKSYDRMAFWPRFAPDGKSIYFVADDDGALALANVSLSDNKVTRAVPGTFAVESFTLAKDGTPAVVLSTMDRPNELFVISNGKLNRLSKENDALLSELKLAEGEYVSFKSKDGTVVHGYIYKPVGYVAGKKYPTLLRPHGGPVWAYYGEFQDQLQLLAANGFLVLAPNPRGSTGYGEDFAKAIFADWGNKDFQDDMAIVDFAIDKGLADPDKLGVGGWSYGGISTDFIIAQTNRFKGAVSGAGSAEFTSMWGHDQYQRDYTAELGYPWENRATWEKVAPFYRVKNITTPTLFAGGASDDNVPILGGEQMYQSLKALGRPTELVVYPDEFHGFKTPSHIKDFYDREIAWFNHYVKQDGSPARPPDPTPAATK